MSWEGVVIVQHTSRDQKVMGSNPSGCWASFFSSLSFYEMSEHYQEPNNMELNSALYRKQPKSLYSKSLVRRASCGETLSVLGSLGVH